MGFLKKIIYGIYGIFEFKDLGNLWDYKKVIWLYVRENEKWFMGFLKKIIWDCGGLFFIFFWGIYIFGGFQYKETYHFSLGHSFQNPFLFTFYFHFIKSILRENGNTYFHIL